MVRRVPCLQTLKEVTVDYKVVKVFRFASGKGGVVTVQFGEQMNVQFRIVKANDGGKCYAFAPQEPKREGQTKQFSLVWFEDRAFSQEVQQAAVDAYLKGDNPENGPGEECPF